MSVRCRTREAADTQLTTVSMTALTGLSVSLAIGAVLSVLPNIITILSKYISHRTTDIRKQSNDRNAVSTRS